MFKNEFNSIYVAVKDFILESKTLQEFIKIDDEISFYRSIVDEYNSIIFNLTNIKNQIAPDHYLNIEIDEVMTQLNDTFNNYYEQSMIVRSYVSEIANLKSIDDIKDYIYKGLSELEDGIVNTYNKETKEAFEGFGKGIETRQLPLPNILKYINLENNINDFR